MHKNNNLYLLLSVLVIGGFVTWGLPFQNDDVNRNESGIPLLYGYTTCGDGIVWDGNEECDDGDTSNGDGCSSLCTVEGGWTCDDASPTVCQLCGNGIKEGTEACDDSDTDSGDGCSATCTIETGFSCVGTTPSVCSSTCGDGVVASDEECDDYDADAGDGCSDTCTVESGWTCDGASPTVCQKCGNGVREGTEACDDGGIANGDGCSSICAIESEYLCSVEWNDPSVCSAAHNSLVGYWPFDTGSGYTAFDGSVSGNNGTLTNMTVADWVSTVPSVSFTNSGSLDFDGSNDYVSVPNGGGLNARSSGSIALWVKWSGSQDAGFGSYVYGPVIARQNDGNWSQHIIGLDASAPATSQIKWLPYTYNNCTVVGVTNVGDGAWRHVVITYENGSHKIYINGSLDGSGSCTGTIEDDSDIPLTIGAWSGAGTGYATALIDEVRVYNKVLSPVEVADLASGDKTIVAVCGNGDIEGEEACDDSDTDAGDGCSAICTVESEWTCDGASPTVCQLCGNGLKEGTEACDDNDTDAGDGCSATCTVESEWTCDGASPTVCQLCGNGIKEGTEACDDSDTDSGDGCSATCTVENGFSCVGTTPSVCSSTCGDGVVASDEGCDDDGTAAGDGCSATCTVESGYSCSGEPSICAETCGNSVLDGAEECDDGGTANSDGCSSSCTVETGWTCENTPMPSTCDGICGDGLIKGTEACDDSDTDSGDGCSSTCTIENGFGCTGEPSTCTSTCGDGVVASDEACDDNGTDAGDGCSDTCTTETGFSCNGEPSICASTCGDGAVASDEGCDDNDTDNGDGCSSACLVETGWSCSGTPSSCSVICGDGIIPGQYAILTARGDNSVTIMDISDPTNPVKKSEIYDGDGEFSKLSGAEHVFGSGNHIFVSSITDDSFSIIDIATVTNPALKSEVYDDGSGAASFGIAFANYAAIASQVDDSVTFLNISNASSPSLSSVVSDGDGEFNYLDGAVSLAISGSYAYVASRYDNSLTIMDISDPSDPVLKSEVYDGDGEFSKLAGARHVYVYGKYAYVISNTESALTIMDISDPTDPVLKSEVYDGDGEFSKLGGASWVYVSGTGAYITSNTDNSLTIMDISDPTNPDLDSEVFSSDGEFSVMTGATSVSVSGDYAYVASSTGDSLTIMDITNPTNPVLKSEVYDGDGEFTRLDNVSSVFIKGFEECDDGNANSFDGCSSTCTVEVGFSCMGDPSSCYAGCGDGVKSSSEACDDGDTDNSDGCSSVCVVENGYSCTGSPSTCTSTCGDGSIASDESCDDNNLIALDGCEADCTILYGYACIGEPSDCDPLCGDGILKGSEPCDDNDTDSGDGCSATCTVETGFSCNGEPSTCASTCGDGTKASDEGCDDGDTTSGDGCSATCTVENGFSCTGTTPSSCTSTCGDGLVASDEACDDGDTDADDGCSATCTVETGYSCTGEASTCTPICGDALITGSEECDDDDTDSDDGCSSVCAIEAGWSCIGTPSVCTEGCGDGLVVGSESCDDNDLDAGDGCSAVCQAEHGFICTGEPSTCASVCGDGLVASDEVCDDDDTDAGDGCSATCTVETYFICSSEPSYCTGICADNIVVGDEPCDDGGTSNGDGCSSSCDVESGWTCSGSPSVCITTCGDSIVAGEEECDPPGADSCSDNCIYNTGGGGSSIGTISGTKESRAEYISLYGILDPNRPLASDMPARGRPLTSCGDNKIQIGEECDDGNTIDFDGCSAFCYREIGYCGDGLLQRSYGEECEPEKILKDKMWVYPAVPECLEEGELHCTAPTSPIGGCLIVNSPICGAPPDAASVEERSYCGDGRKDPGEECDLGGICIGGKYHGTLWRDRNAALLCNGNGGESFPRSGDGCDDKCNREFCGDGYIQSVEECDNGGVCSNDVNMLCRSDSDCAGGSCNYNSALNTACTSSCDLCYGMYRANIDLDSVKSGKHTLKVKVTNPCGVWSVEEINFTVEPESTLSTQSIPIHNNDLPLRTTTAQVRRGISPLHLSLVSNKERFVSGVDQDISLSLIVSDNDGNLVYSLPPKAFAIAIDDKIVNNVTFQETTSDNCALQIQQLRISNQKYDCNTPRGTSICGDGIKESNEECDDGNLKNSDGCSDKCINELFKFAAPAMRGAETGGVYLVPTFTSSVAPASCKVPIQFELTEGSIQSSGRSLLTKADGIDLALSDVPSDAWFATFVDAVARKGIISGYRDNYGRPLGIFKPEASVTLAEMAKMVSEAAKLGTSGKEPTTLTARGHWAQGYISKLEEFGASAFQDSDVDVDSHVSRGLVVLSIIEVLGIMQNQSQSIFIDLPANHPYSSAMNTAASLGIIEGDKDTMGIPLFTVRPDDTINRAEITKVISRFLQSCSLGTKKGLSIQGSIIEIRSGGILSTEVLLVSLFVSLCAGLIAYRKKSNSHIELHE
ncbi:MAG: DUF4215 domain-containing protein [Kiritimatiellales bacterium]|nr:DUF4215 domain-containing protein [Kiritimatiellales bacterium]